MSEFVATPLWGLRLALAMLLLVIAGLYAAFRWVHPWRTHGEVLLDVLAVVGLIGALTVALNPGLF